MTTNLALCANPSTRTNRSQAAAALALKAVDSRVCCIKRRQPTTIVIGISVNADHQSITAMLGAGAAMLIPKEAAVTELYHAVKRVWKPVYETGASAPGV